MGTCKITYEEACALHPDEVKKVIAAFRKSKSKKAKKQSPDTFDWGYQYSQVIHALSVQEKLSHATVDEQVTEWESRIMAVQLHAKCKGLVGWTADVDPVPEPLRRWKVEQVKANMKKQAEFEALPAGEQEQAIVDILVQLRGQPGFFEISTKVRRWPDE